MRTEEPERRLGAGSLLLRHCYSEVNHPPARANPDDVAAISERSENVAVRLAVRIGLAQASQGLHLCNIKVANLSASHEAQVIVAPQDTFAGCVESSREVDINFGHFVAVERRFVRSVNTG